LHATQAVKIQFEIGVELNFFKSIFQKSSTDQLAFPTTLALLVVPALYSTYQASKFFRNQLQQSPIGI
jgi:hypothetical protein